MNDPRQKICPFSFAPVDSEESDNNASGSELIQVYDLYSKTDLRRLWPTIFEGAVIINGDSTKCTETLKREFFRNVSFDIFHTNYEQNVNI